MKSITPERNQQELQEVGGTDFGFAFGDKARFRVAVFKQRGLISMVLRRIPNEFLTFEQLGLPPVIEELIQRPRGLFLVTGPTGSGKTTSLASMLNWMNHNMDHHIITLEDPIEYYHKHQKCTFNQREIGVDVPSFPEALRRALRMDPDVILVGEMRDLETISAAITAAETGHVVFGTLHTTGAQGTVDRIIDVFPTNQQEQIRTQLSVAIIGILSQALLAEKTQRAGGGLRTFGGHAGDCEPDSRSQDLPDQLLDSNRAEIRDATPGRCPVQPVERRAVRREGRDLQIQSSRRTQSPHRTGQTRLVRGRGRRRGRRRRMGR